MNTREKIIQAIFNAIDELNNELDLQNQLKKDDETILLGKNSHLDSLGFVNLIVSIEEFIEDEFDKTIIIANEKAMSQTRSPFKTVATLAEYIEGLLG